MSPFEIGNRVIGLKADEKRDNIPSWKPSSRMAAILHRPNECKGKHVTAQYLKERDSTFDLLRLIRCKNGSRRVANVP